ncbi:DUF3859 domain-containing protein [Vannielia litorea]|uniref:DUF3859 domain-containing protein n=1 Tax=Vannielia litorea TaxID=1217970 RepID=UPI001C94ACA9|nr:DUF3859 domain-containing protein [Vannielia litorea]MBY6155274.1 DUF3859 domain-containing protein [Vannielia litorea]
MAAHLLGAPAALAQSRVEMDGSRLAALEFGLVCPLRTIGSREAPGTENGRIEIFEGDPRFVESHRVPATLGASFGVRVWAREGQRRLAVTVRSLHPPFSGTGTREQSFASSIAPDAPMTHIYTFDMPHEAVPGLWQLEAMAEGSLLYSVTFEVVAPAAYQGPAPDCTDAPVLSLGTAPMEPAG